MRGNTCWNYRPYTRLIDMDVRDKPFICRVAPFETGFEIQWFDNGQPEGEHKLNWRVYLAQDEWEEMPLTGDTARVEGLVERCDYEFKVVRCDGSGESGLRLAHTTYVPGTVVNYLHPEDKTYIFSGHSLCSPTMVRLPSGDLMTAMDVFSPQFGNSKLTLLFKSKDNGGTWRYVTELFPCYWPKLFVHRGKLYMLANVHDFGDLMIGCSEDEGETWSLPTHLITGCGPWEAGPHKAPTPVVEQNGRIYTAIDYGAGRYAAGMLSIDADADLMDAASWSYTPFLPYDSKWPGAPVGEAFGYEEGNAVISPDGVVCNYLRINHANCVPWYGKACVLRCDREDPEAPLTFDRIVDCPLGSNSKFQISKDEATGKYIMIGTEQSERTPGRTVLSMAVSEDFYTWQVVKRLLDDRNADPNRIGFQYPEWIFDGEDLLVLVRTAFGPSSSFHDANYQTFLRVENYRQYIR